MSKKENYRPRTVWSMRGKQVAFRRDQRSPLSDFGFVYDSAEQAEARFREEDDGYIYSRFGNPTVRMFEERMMALEGAEDARATATGMAAVTAAMLSLLQAGDHVVAARALLARAAILLKPCCRATALKPRWLTGAIQMHGNRPCANNQSDVPRNAVQSGTRSY